MSTLAVAIALSLMPVPLRTSIPKDKPTVHQTRVPTSGNNEACKMVNKA